MDRRRAEALDPTALVPDDAGAQRTPAPRLRELPSDDGPTVDGARGREAGRPRTELFGIPIELAEPAQMLHKITEWAGDGQARRVMYVNAHVVNQSLSEDLPELRRALCSADLIYCDGYGVRMAARTLNLPVPHRMTGADWVWALAALCELTGDSLYLLGSDPAVARQAAVRLQRWYPRLQIVGSHHGYSQFESPQNDRVIEDINARGASIVLVGMGTPRQELWIDRYAHRIEADVLWSVGALFDYLAGRVPRAPGWLADNGLEWIFRLAVEPHRMWRRYLLGNPVFLARVLSAKRQHESGASKTVI